MPAELPPLVRGALQRLVRAFAPRRVVLFGSYAKGQVRTGSDVDVLFVTVVHRDAAERRLRVRHLTRGCFPPIDVAFATPAEVASVGEDATSLFLRSILENGITVYERS